MEKNKCIICGGDMIFLLQGKDYLYKALMGNFSIFRCRFCMLEQILPLPEKETILSMYPEEYYSFNMHKGGLLTKFKKNSTNLLFKIKSPLIKKFLKIIFNEIYYFGFPQNNDSAKSILDIGCGNGYDVQLMEKNGFDAYGFEIGMDNINKKIYYGESLEAKHFGDRKFDWIRMWHVLEHVPDPHKYLGEISKLLTPGGVLIIAIPNMKSFASFLFGKYNLNRDIPRHLFNYNSENIIKLLEMHNFSVTKIKYQSLNGVAGSIGNFLNDKFGININGSTNAFIVLLFYPLEFLLHCFGLSDQISIRAIKNSQCIR